MSHDFISGYYPRSYLDAAEACADAEPDHAPPDAPYVDPVDQREALIRLAYEVAVRVGADSAVQAALGSYIDGGDAADAIEALEQWLGADRADTDWAQARIRRMKATSE